MSFLPGPERRSLAEKLGEVIREGAGTFLPFLVREPLIRDGRLNLWEPPGPVGYILLTEGPCPETFFVDEDFESLRLISGTSLQQNSKETQTKVKRK